MAVEFEKYTVDVELVRARACIKIRSNRASAWYKRRKTTISHVYDPYKEEVIGAYMVQAITKGILQDVDHCHQALHTHTHTHTHAYINTYTYIHTYIHAYT